MLKACRYTPLALEETGLAARVVVRLVCARKCRRDCLLSEDRQVPRPSTASIITHASQQRPKPKTSSGDRFRDRQQPQGVISQDPAPRSHAPALAPWRVAAARGPGCRRSLRGRARHPPEAEVGSPGHLHAGSDRSRPEATQVTSAHVSRPEQVAWSSPRGCSWHAISMEGRSEILTVIPSVTAEEERRTRGKPEPQAEAEGGRRPCAGWQSGRWRSMPGAEQRAKEALQGWY